MANIGDNTIFSPSVFSPGILGRDNVFGTYIMDDRNGTGLLEQPFGAGASAAYSLYDLGNQRGTVVESEGTYYNPVVRLRRDSDGTHKSFTAIEIQNGTALEWVKEEASVYTSDWRVGADGWGSSAGGDVAQGDQSAGGEDDCLSYYAGATFGYHGPRRNSIFTIGRDYRLVFDVYIPSGQSNTVGAYFFNNSVVYGGTTTLDTWVTLDFTFTAGETTLKINQTDGPLTISGSNFTGAGSASDDLIYLKNLVAYDLTQDAYIRQLYDQSGNDRDFDQSTEADQRVFASGGVENVDDYGNNSIGDQSGAGFYAYNFGSTQSQPFTIAYVGGISNGEYAYASYTEDASNGATLYGGTNFAFVNAGTALQTGKPDTSGTTAYVSVYSGASTVVYADGTPSGSGDSGAKGIDGWTLGALPNGTTPVTKPITAFIVWLEDKTSDIPQISQSLTDTFLIPNYFSFEVPTGFTCTGLAYDPTAKTLWSGDFVGGGLYEFEKDGTSVGSHSTALAANSFQGLAFDTSDDTLWACDRASNLVYHLSQTGGTIGTIDVSTEMTSPNGILYDANTDSILVTPQVGFTAYWYRCSDGVNTGTFTLPVNNFDGITIDPSDGHYVATRDDTVFSVVYKVNSSTGAIISQDNRNFTSIEMPAFDADGNMWLTDDSEYHDNTPSGNRVYRCTSTGLPK